MSKGSIEGSEFRFNTTDELIEDISEGKMVILVDDENRENEGDLVLAADHASPEHINFMIKEARGLVCLSLSAAQIERLRLPLMVTNEANFSPNKTAFTVSIEAASGVTTGISAADRAHTVHVASRPDAKPEDLHRPGHIFPIRAQDGGVLRRAGHTEGSVDLTRLAGLNPAAVICEVMKEDGTMARVQDLKMFAKKHKIKIGTIVDLIEYRLSRDILVEEILDAKLPEGYREFRARIFRSKIDGIEHLVLQRGDIRVDEPILVRVNLDSYSGDIFSFLQGGKTSAQRALQKILETEAGLFVLLRSAQKPQSLQQEVRGLRGESPVADMDSRDYGIGAQILRLMGVHKIRLLSNSFELSTEFINKMVGLKAFDLEIVEIVPLKADKDNDEKAECDNEDGSKNWSGHCSVQ